MYIAATEKLTNETLGTDKDSEVGKLTSDSSGKQTFYARFETSYCSRCVDIVKFVVHTFFQFAVDPGVSGALVVTGPLRVLLNVPDSFLDGDDIAKVDHIINQVRSNLKFDTHAHLSDI